MSRSRDHSGDFRDGTRRIAEFPQFTYVVGTWTSLRVVRGLFRLSRTPNKGDRGKSVDGDLIESPDMSLHWESDSGKDPVEEI